MRISDWSSDWCSSDLVDAYGVGTRLVTGSGSPTAGMVYKLVARAGDDGTMVSVEKKSPDKVSHGGRKYALRRRNRRGIAEAEVIGVGHHPADERDRAGERRVGAQGGSTGRAE